MERARLTTTGSVTLSETGVHWQIPRFCSLPHRSDNLLASPPFTFAERAWQMKVHPNKTYDNERSGWIEIHVRQEHVLRASRDLIIRLGISRGFQEHILNSRAEFDGTRTFSCKKLILRSHLQSWKHVMVQGGHLHVFFSLENENDDIGVDLALQDNTNDRIVKLQLDLKEMARSGHFSDVILKVKGQDFKVHRCMLAARSPVFMAMMTHDTKESNSGVVVIPDIDPDTLTEFLNFVYSGNVENLSSELAVKLFTVADKYQVNDLRHVCFDYMMKNISVDTFCDVYALSLKHEEHGLKEACYQFFTGKSLDIVTSAKWQIFISENPILGNDLFIRHLQSYANPDESDMDV